MHGDRYQRRFPLPRGVGVPGQGVGVPARGYLPGGHLPRYSPVDKQTRVKT